MHCKLIFLSLLAIAAQLGGTTSGKSYRTVAYFGNWAIYGNFTPQDLPAGSLTHVLYAFADINPDTGEVFLTDPRADIEKPLSGDSLNATGNNLQGCLGQLYLLKKQNRALKVMLAIGGWTYSSHFASPASSSEGRSKFASSVISLVKSYGLDGVDIDWEYPADASQATDMITLLQAVRDALDTYGNSLRPQYHFTLSAACPGPYGYRYLNLSAINQTVDFFNVMAFDYTGPWSQTSGDQANLFPSSSIPSSTPFNTEAIINYISQSVHPEKIVLGVPLYGRAFNSTGGLGEQFNGSRIYNLKDLPLTGCAEVNDDETGSSYCYGNRELISYDSVPVARLKAAFIQNKALGGAMFWESSMDYKGNDSIIQNVAGALAKDDAGLDSTWNQLLYPDSPYDNLLKSAPQPSLATITVTTGCKSSYTSSSYIGSITTPPSPLRITPSPSCTITDTLLLCPGGLCVCDADVTGTPVCFSPLGSCEGLNCTASSDCTTNAIDNETICMAGKWGFCNGSARCVKPLEGCVDSPQVSEIDFVADSTSISPLN